MIVFKNKGEPGYEEFPMNADNVNANFAELRDMIYPIGSVYISVNNVNPANLFGGVWEQIKDRFLLGSGDNYSAGATGGEATHTLTINEMPKHFHEFVTPNEQGMYEQPRYIPANSGTNKSYGRVQNVMGTMENGADEPHNNMPPYLAVYIWKRIS